MGNTLKGSFLFFFAACAGLIAEPGGLSPNAIVESYVTHSQAEQKALDGASMEVDIDATLPKLKKFGRLHALRHISKLGRITYDRLRWEGDGTVKNNVIARYLAAEVQAQSDTGRSFSITPENYKFKYKGSISDDGRRVYMFQVSPRKKRVGLFKGELWIDALTFLRVRESGHLVKNPSIFLKRVEFVRKYVIRDGISVPVQIQSIVDTRLVGKAELTVDFRNVSLDQNPNRASLVDFDGQ